MTVNPLAPVAASSVAGRISLEDALAVCVAKTRANIRRLADTPQSAAYAADGDYFQGAEDFFDIGNWTSSYFTGMAALAYLRMRDSYFLEQLDRLAEHYRCKVFVHHADTTHDLGFLYTLYSVALFKLTGDVRHRATGLRAAEVLAARAQPGGYLRAWGRLDERNTGYAGLATVDSMMNLPLLFWAAEETRNAHFRRIAVEHADATLANMVRPDGSVCHGYRFDVATGKPQREDNACGRGENWARGTAWAFYGFALAYRYAGDPRYLEAALRIARRFLESLDADLIPAQDFRPTAGDPPVRDAAAIGVCGLQELLRHRPDDRALAAGAARLLARLCAPDCLDVRATVPGILKQAQTGDGLGQASSPHASWGDFFLMEALAHELKIVDTFW